MEPVAAVRRLHCKKTYLVVSFKSWRCRVTAAEVTEAEGGAV